MKMNLKEKELKGPLEGLFHPLEPVDHLLDHLDLGHQDLKDHLHLVVQEDLEDLKMDHHLVDLLEDLVVQDLMGHLEAEVVAVEEGGGEEGALTVPSEEVQKWDSEEEVDLEVGEEDLEVHQVLFFVLGCCHLRSCIQIYGFAISLLLFFGYRF